jgi:hypothetical protein
MGGGLEVTNALPIVGRFHYHLPGVERAAAKLVHLRKLFTEELLKAIVEK